MPLSGVLPMASQHPAISVRDSKRAPLINTLEVLLDVDVGGPVRPSGDGHLQVDADAKGQGPLGEGQQLGVQLHAACPRVEAGVALLGPEMVFVDAGAVLHGRLILCTPDAQNYHMGIDISMYAMHSLRRGGVIAAWEANVPRDLLKLHGKWRSDAIDAYLQAPIALRAEDHNVQDRPAGVHELATPVHPRVTSSAHQATSQANNPVLRDHIRPKTSNQNNSKDQ